MVSKTLQTAQHWQAAPSSLSAPQLWSLGHQLKGAQGEPQAEVPASPLAA